MLPILKTEDSTTVVNKIRYCGNLCPCITVETVDCHAFATTGREITIDALMTAVATSKATTYDLSSFCTVHRIAAEVPTIRLLHGGTKYATVEVLYSKGGS